MRANIISVGSFKRNDGYSQLFAEYQKRIGYRVELIEVKNAASPGVEGKSIIKNLGNNFKMVALDGRGEMLTSEDLRELCNGFFESCGGINFVIGGANGLSEEVLGAAHFRLSFGKMVFPHLLARVMLIEQLYRIYTMNCNHPYHRA
ncbi:MAG: 23S rRNA (pseudouridine(1915)-N(3))-methyltransferase RlmH [Rickettsiales bacterium]|nr:23S rRNA (pseudouridine(1915)-N(3))-methyltransferase RlmH [Rickettsiales bacterium]